MLHHALHRTRSLGFLATPPLRSSPRPPSSPRRRRRCPPLLIRISLAVLPILSHLLLSPHHWCCFLASWKQNTRPPKKHYVPRSSCNLEEFEQHKIKFAGWSSSRSTLRTAAQHWSFRDPSLSGSLEDV